MNSRGNRLTKFQIVSLELHPVALRHVHQPNGAQIPAQHIARVVAVGFHVRFVPESLAILVLAAVYHEVTERVCVDELLLAQDPERGAYPVGVAAVDMLIRAPVEAPVLGLAVEQIVYAVILVYLCYEILSIQFPKHFETSERAERVRAVGFE